MNDDKLQRVIQEEMSKILKPADSVQKDLDNRNRNDRLQPNDKQSSRWYKNQNSGNVRDQLRQIVAEEYETLRDEPDTSIEHRSGLRDFEVPKGKSGRWYTDDRGNVDTEKIEEAAKLLTKKVLVEKKLSKLSEMGGDTFRQRAKNTRSFDGLYEIFQDMRRFLPGPDQVLQEIAKSMGRESLKEAITYIARMWDMQDIRQQAKNARSTGDLMEILDRMELVRGKENLINDFIKQMSNDELRNMIDHFDRLYLDQMREYPNI